MSLINKLFVAIVSITVLVGLFVNDETVGSLAAIVLFSTIVTATIIVLFFQKKI